MARHAATTCAPEIAPAATAATFGAATLAPRAAPAAACVPRTAPSVDTCFWGRSANMFDCVPAIDKSKIERDA